jgi:hypothetical protein
LAKLVVGVALINLSVRVGRRSCAALAIRIRLGCGPGLAVSVGLGLAGDLLVRIELGLRIALPLRIELAQRVALARESRLSLGSGVLCGRTVADAAERACRGRISAQRRPPSPGLDGRSPGHGVQRVDIDGHD